MAENQVAPWVIEYLVDGKGNHLGEPLKHTVLALDESDAREVLLTHIAKWRSYEGKKVEFVRTYRTSIYD